MTDDSTSERTVACAIDWNQLVALSRRYDLGPTADTEKTRQWREARMLRRLLTARRRVRTLACGTAGGETRRALFALAMLDSDRH